MKKYIILMAAAAMTLQANAQGANTRMGGNDGDYQSLAERITGLEKKNDAFNVYFNYAASARASEQDGTWETGFANKQLRLEIKGNLTDKLFYRLRHRMNKSNAAKGQDNFAKATDIMMVGYNFSDKLSVMGGKMCQIWGGFEFDENPMYIYQYSDMVDNMDNFMAGVTVSYKPVPTQEIAVEVSDANNGTFFEDHGDGAVAVGKAQHVSPMEQSHNPLTYIVNWNGSFFNDVLQTRWSWGLQTLARHKYSQMLVFGQKLNLPSFQWYLDYMGANDGLDRLGIASGDLMSVYAPAVDNGYFSDVHYDSFITKANWQFAPKWNLMGKAMYELASIHSVEAFKNYRTSIGWVGSLEYYPLKDQDLRFFVAYVGRQHKYSAESMLENINTNRIELGFRYRIKAY